MLTASRDYYRSTAMTNAEQPAEDLTAIVVSLRSTIENLDAIELTDPALISKRLAVLCHLEAALDAFTD